MHAGMRTKGKIEKNKEEEGKNMKKIKTCLLHKGAWRMKQESQSEREMSPVEYED